MFNCTNLFEQGAFVVTWVEGTVMMSLNNFIIREQLCLLSLQQDLYVQREGLRYQLFILWDKEEKQQKRRIKVWFNDWWLKKENFLKLILKGK